MNINLVTLIGIIIIIAGVGFGIYDIYKKKKTEKDTVDSVELITIFGEEIVNSLTKAISITQKKISDYNSIDEYKQNIIKLATDFLADELKSRNLYPTCLKDGVLEEAISTGLSKFADALKINEGYFQKRTEEAVKLSNSTPVIDEDIKTLAPEENPLIDTSDASQAEDILNNGSITKTAKDEVSITDKVSITSTSDSKEEIPLDKPDTPIVNSDTDKTSVVAEDNTTDEK